MRFFPSSSWWSAWLSLMRRRDHEQLGIIWEGPDQAAQAKSVAAGKKVRLCVRNATDQTILMCWVDNAGKPHHFYPLHPVDDDKNAASKPITMDDRVEKTFAGHTFLFATADDCQQVAEKKSLEGATLIGAYRPLVRTVKDDRSEYPVHLLIIDNNNKKEDVCCHPFLRKRKYSQRQDDDGWNLSVRIVHLDPTPFDTTAKHYDEGFICGWPVCTEKNWNSGDQEIEKCWQDDFKAVQTCLPVAARESLRSNTPVWINRTFKYGPAAWPSPATGGCFHPDIGWLKKHKFHPDKQKCVEFYNASKYCKSRKLWGTGGLLLHELSHAYHNKILKDGYDNKQVEECYEAAMKEGLYESVPVHGYDGTYKDKAYACTDPMEYFAELSAAFLGGTDDKEEFNKWYPFNRKQLKEHDPRAFEMLKKLWKVDDC